MFLVNISTKSLGRRKNAKIKSRLISSSEAVTILLKGVAIEHEEPYEGRLSRTVRWEGIGEIPLPEPIGHYYRPVCIKKIFVIFIFHKMIYADNFIHLWLETVFLFERRI